MGVPALYRFLSRKYPKIVSSVVEDHPTVIGDVTIPVDTTQANPNGGPENDNLYLDMNGIVHPCCHPETGEAPKTEEDMMKAIFIYTDRVVNMVRPRKLLFMAIDGVAPRAKMNQQRSRRFRAAQEAATKEEDRVKAIAEWEALGKEMTEEFKNEKGWDSNAITPGTPFMALLAKSLRYWTAKKLNEDPGWAGLQIIISDASVPGEGEHKIMDFIRRQRTQSSHDPNTKHVIYGLDADLIMLSLATHEPHFKVLREDVSAQDKKPRGCHTCGQPGHHSSQCTGKPRDKQGEADAIAKSSPLKPFIFLDVATLREYLAVELSAPIHSFPFQLERAIDDWIFLIFFVGNDFLPHLPSLEIREGAIDTLMGIWKSNLDRMGGYLAENGKVHLERAQVILEALAEREDEIFKKRREAEERQDKGQKRRRIEAEHRQNGTHLQNGHDYVAVRPLPSTPALPHALPVSSTLSLGPSSLPARPTWVVDAPTVEPVMKAATNKAQTQAKAEELATMGGGSNSSIVANRKAIRMANLNAAEMLKAEIASGKSGKPTDGTATVVNGSAAARLKAEMMGEEEVDVEMSKTVEDDVDAETEDAEMATSALEPITQSMELSSPSRGIKRKAEEDAVAEVVEEEEEDEEPAILLPPGIAGAHSGTPQLVLMGNNVAEQEDIVKLWEPGYKERYYRQKFGVELGDTELRNKVVKSYVEGLCWVLEYYFQGAPSWQWYYPYHFSPFASDFVDLANLDIKFDLGAAVQPFEQLMSVFPAASRIHLPEPFHKLMTDDDSPIIDFYPIDFDIDMNGKKMVWQGVALLPFVDAARLKEQMRIVYGELTESEVHRNTLGSDSIFVGKDHPLYTQIEGLYVKRRATKPIPLDTKLSKKMAGFVLADSNCIPGATFDSPLPDFDDIYNDQSISAAFSFPPQATPHRSVLLPGVSRAAVTLNSYDKDNVRRGGGEGSANSFHTGGRGNQNQDRGPGFARLDNRSRGGYQGSNNGNGGNGASGRGGYQGGGGGGSGRHTTFEGGRSHEQPANPYSGYDNGSNRGGYNGSYAGPGQQSYQSSPATGYGYGAAAASSSSSSGGGYRPPSSLPSAAPSYGPTPPTRSTYSSGPQLYGLANLGPSQGQYGYSSGPPSSNRNGLPVPPVVAPPAYSGYGGYGGSSAPAARGGGHTQPPSRRY